MFPQGIVVAVYYKCPNEVMGIVVAVYYKCRSNEVMSCNVSPNEVMSCNVSPGYRCCCIL